MNEETKIRSRIARGSRSMKTAKYANHANGNQNPKPVGLTYL